MAAKLKGKRGGKSPPENRKGPKPLQGFRLWTSLFRFGDAGTNQKIVEKFQFRVDGKRRKELIVSGNIPAVSSETVRRVLYVMKARNANRL